MVQTPEPIIVFDHVVKTFQQRDSKQVARAVDDVSITINQGDIFGVIGYSGAGKSTLVRMINALEKPTSGSVSVMGHAVSAMSESQLRPVRQKIGMIFQQFNLFSQKTVAQNIAYPLQLDHWRKDYQDRRVKELLEFVGLSDHANKYPSQLSGGQKQRVGIARALATNPQILLADEATSALDPETTTEVLELLKRVNEQFGITIVLITHQMNVVQQIANRVAVMSAGRVVEQGTTYSVFAAPQQDVTRRFIATAMDGLPDEARVNVMREQWPGRLVTVVVRQHPILDADGNTLIAASGQNISDLIAKHGVHSGLLYGGIDTVQGVAIGAMTYEFTGPVEQIDAFLTELAQHSDIVDFGTKDNPVAYDEAVSRAHIAAAPASKPQMQDTVDAGIEQFEQVDDVETIVPTADAKRAKERD
ncbi:methionine ABC transporter ATP-binding protein [Bifidobacterium gallicum]|uniref:ABC transporter, ATP-binding protein n=1 Tax=Bifidobacterium gallicum DSM 20093 = LMG 11596 TaxID=561180 RepID=D1NRX6_9BIFI|nr:methionine ABC transporter ATP-binding protein [Bifidobacterium gallicum]EFA23427.1 ABC transporter, ATP-binding protein [Bifidobacterium gallicum DSM 20093 = LMG 11596]KFI57279.1 methionine ABC transporter ATP-binding protein [Bifidobacterium gallicum DSM 20093 = LMG 11596]